MTAPIEDPRLTVGRKVVYGLGDYTVNTVLTSLSFFYVLFFLVQVAGLRPELAGLVQLIARAVDAFTDPAMGRLSDRTRLRAGRRRPYFLIGAIPFGLSFALLWWDVPLESQGAKFAYYTAVYCALSISMTSVSVPYLALQPEMALGYDARTSLNAYRNAGSVVGVLAAIAFRPVANALGGGSEGFGAAAILYGIMLALPWVAIYGVTWEKASFQSRESQISFVAGTRMLIRHRNYRRLMGLYLCGRISMDLAGAMLVLYFSFWIGRSADFEPTMLLFFLVVLASIPFWVAISRRTEKGRVFIAGSFWWLGAQLLLVLAQPDWPRWVIFALPPLVGIGYAVVDLFPWAMLGEVVDEDDLASGERREGLYYGYFTFIRKLAGSLAVWLAAVILGQFGYTEGVVQGQDTREAIRLMTSLGPALFVGLGIVFAWGYPLTRRRHEEILAALAARDRL